MAKLSDMIKKATKVIYKVSPINAYKKAEKSTAEYLNKKAEEKKWKTDYLKNKYPGGYSDSAGQREEANNAFKKRIK